MGWNTSWIEAAGKTGTTNDYYDHWFCGYTPYYTIAVWIGEDTPAESAYCKDNTYTGKIWTTAMKNLCYGKSAKDFDLDEYENKTTGSSNNARTETTTSETTTQETTEQESDAEEDEVQSESSASSPDEILSETDASDESGQTETYIRESEINTGETGTDSQETVTEAETPE